MVTESVTVDRPGDVVAFTEYARQLVSVSELGATTDNDRVKSRPGLSVDSVMVKLPAPPGANEKTRAVAAPPTLSRIDVDQNMRYCGTDNARLDGNGVAVGTLEPLTTEIL